MRVVVAPDSFKGSATALVAAAAIGRGWHGVRPHDDLVLLPMADGGEGTLDALVAPADRRARRVAGPDGPALDAVWGMRADRTAVVELAASSGLALLAEPAPLTASTRGFGELIGAALDAGARRLLLAVGGSASTDGGAGLLSALGARLLDAEGRSLPDGGGSLERLATVDLAGLLPLPAGGAAVLTDVRNPLLGAQGAAAVYGPQKGAGPLDVALLERGLRRLAALLPADPGARGAGAAGGAAFGLLAWGAVLESGAAAVADAVGLPAAVASADLLITGEGRFDDQSAHGKVPAFVADLAAASGVPALLVAGAITAPTVAFANALALEDLVGRDRAFGDPVAALELAGGALARGAH